MAEMIFCQETESERLDRLKSLLALSRTAHTHMERVNAYFRKHGTVQGCPGVAPDAAKIIDDGIKQGDYPDGLPFSTHEMLHDYYEIQRLEQEIKKLESRMDKFVGWTFPDGEARINTEKNQLQLKFDKGVSTMRQIILRQYGFSWSSVDKVWERRLSREAIHAASFIKFVRPSSGVSPEKLQSYAQRERGKEDR